MIGGATNSAAAGITLSDNLPTGTRQTFAMQRGFSRNGTSGYVWLAVSGPLPATLVWSRCCWRRWKNNATYC